MPFSSLKTRTVKEVREAHSLFEKQCHQVYIYEYLPTNTEFPVQKWIIADYPVSQASDAYRLVGDFLAKQFADPDDQGTAALTEQDIEAVRKAVSGKLKSKLKSEPE